MSLLDRKQYITADLSSGKILNENVVFYYDTDKNITNFYLKFETKNSSNENYIFLQREEIENFKVELFILKPNGATGEVDGKLDENSNMFIFELTPDYTSQIGKYKSELNVTFENETASFNYFIYEINRSLKYSATEMIVEDEKYPILVKLINEVEDLKEGIESGGNITVNVAIEDNLTTDSSTKALSAKQGKILNDTKVDKVDNKTLTTNDLTDKLKANYDSAYEHSKSVHFDGDYNSLKNIPDISKFVNEEDMDTQLTEIKNNYATKESIPDKTSDLTNDSDFITGITKTQVEEVLTGDISTHTHSQYLTEHQDISNLATKTYVDGLVGNIETLLGEI